MRELLFRGRFKVNKFRWNGTPRKYEFIESKTHHISAIHFNNNGDISHVVIPYKDTCITLFPDYFTTFDIQQYTGIKDKNGVKIFDGDIVKRKYVPIGADPKVIEYYYIGCIVFECNSWEVAMYKEGTRVIDSSKALSHHKTREKPFYKGRGYIYHNSTFESLEVIGNIHDNPDLIK